MDTFKKFAKSLEEKVESKKENKVEKDIISKLVSKLFEARDVAHLAHLKMKGVGSYAGHIALQEFYEGILEYTDKIAETAQGCEEVLLDITIPATKHTEPYAYLKLLKEEVLSYRDKVEYEFQKNIIDEITALIAQTMYKLKFLS